MNVDVLFDRLDRVRGRERAVSVSAGVFRTVLALLGLVVAFFLIDWIILSRSVEAAGTDRLARAILVATMAGTLVYVFWINIWIPLVAALDDDEIALRVESRHPELHGRLISTIQLSREEAGKASGSQELIDALEEDTISFSQSLNFQDIISVETLKKVGIAASLLLLLATALGAWQQDYAKALMNRMLLSQTTYPTATRILAITEGGVVPRGEARPVEAELDPDGFIPEKATLLVKTFEGGEIVEYTMSRVEDRTDCVLFRGTIERVMDDLKYSVQAHDARWIDWEIVKSLRRPAVKSLVLKYTYPKYSGMPDAERNAGDIRALQGTVVRIEAQLSKPVVSARLVQRLGQNLIDPEKMDVNEECTLATATIKVEDDGYYKILLRDDNGLENSFPIEYMIDAMEDRPPLVNVTFPKRDRTVTRFAAWPVRFEARDDHGLARGSLKFRVDTFGREGNVAEGTIRSFQLSGLVKQAGQKRTTAEAVFDLKVLDLELGNRLVFWVEIEDNREPEPNVGKSRECEFTIASAEEVLFLIESMRDEALGRIEEIRKREEENKKAVDDIRQEIRLRGRE